MGSPVTPGAALAMFVYSGSTIVTLFMAIMRHEHWWYGLIVMAALVLFSVLEAFCWMVAGVLFGSIAECLRARKEHDLDGLKDAKKCLKDDATWVITFPFLVGAIVAVFGLIAIPAFLWEWISDWFSEIRKRTY